MVEVHLDKALTTSLKVSMKAKVTLLVAFRQVLRAFQIMSKFRCERLFVCLFFTVLMNIFYVPFVTFHRKKYIF